MAFKGAKTQKKTYQKGKTSTESRVQSEVEKIEKNGVTYVKAWKFQKFVGLLTFFVSPPAGDAVIRTSEKAGSKKIDWHSAKVVVTNVTMMSRSVFPCWVNPNNMEVFIKDLNVRISPVTKRVHIFNKNDK